MKFKSRAIPVEATQFNEESYESLKHLIDTVEDFIRKGFDSLGHVSYDLCESYTTYYLTEDLGATEIAIGDWIVQFPNGEVHVVQDKHFQQRFEHVKEYTKTELSYAHKLAEIGGCE